MRPVLITNNLYPLLPVVPKNVSKDEEKNCLPKKSSRNEVLDENIDYQLSTCDNDDEVMVEIDSQWHHLLVVGLMTLILDWVYLIGCSKFVFNSM